MAAQAGLDLAAISGSRTAWPHRQGRYRGARWPAPPAAAAPAADGPRAAPPPRRPPPAPTAARRSPAGAAYTEMPHTSMRKVIARRLTESKQTVPHFYLTRRLRDRRAAEAPRRSSTARDGADYKLSVNDFVIKAVGAGAAQGAGGQRRPGATTSCSSASASTSRSRWRIDGGLITPIIASADQKGLPQISAEMKDLAAPRQGRQAEARGVPGRHASRSPTSACTASASSRP